MLGLVPAAHSSQHPPPWGSAPAPHPPAPHWAPSALPQPSQPHTQPWLPTATGSPTNAALPLLVPACPMLRAMGGGPTEPPFIPNVNPLPDTRVPSPSCTQPLSPIAPPLPPASPLRALVGCCPPPPRCPEPPLRGHPRHSPWQRVPEEDRQQRGAGSGEGTRRWLTLASSSSPAAEHRLLLLLWCGGVGRPGWGPTLPSLAPAPPHRA